MGQLLCFFSYLYLDIHRFWKWNFLFNCPIYKSVIQYQPVMQTKLFIGQSSIGCADIQYTKQFFIANGGCWLDFTHTHTVQYGGWWKFSTIYFLSQRKIETHAIRLLGGAIPQDKTLRFASAAKEDNLW